MLQKNEILVLDDIVYKIYTIDDFETMRKTVLESIQFLIPHDGSSFFLSSKENPYMLSNPVGWGIGIEYLGDYDASYQSLDYTRWTFSHSKGNAYRDTDLLEDDIRINTPYYKKLYKKIGAHYSLLLTIIYEGTFYGAITLYRTRGEKDFSDKEVFLLELLGKHLGYRCSKEKSYFEGSLRNRTLRKDLIESYNLTKREIEVIEMLIDNLSSKTICDKLCISPNTLKKHTTNIYRKLNINSWRELMQLFCK